MISQRLITKLKLGLIAILVLIVITMLASNSATPNSKILFNLKRAQEKAFFKLKSSDQDKLSYNLGLLSNRLSEIESVVKNKKYEHILNSSLRYSTLAGQITESAKQLGNDQYIASVKQVFLDQKPRIQELINNYPKDQNVEWKYLQDDINYLDIYLEQLTKK